MRAPSQSGNTRFVKQTPPFFHPPYTAHTPHTKTKDCVSMLKELFPCLKCNEIHSHEVTIIDNSPYSLSFWTIHDDDDNSCLNDPSIDLSSFCIEVITYEPLLRPSNYHIPSCNQLGVKGANSNSMPNNYYAWSLDQSNGPLHYDMDCFSLFFFFFTYILVARVRVVRCTSESCVRCDDGPFSLYLLACA